MEEEGGGFFRNGSTTATPSKNYGGNGGAPRDNPITPLTCKQISRAEQLPSGVISIDGREMHMVTIVGQVVDKDEQSAVVVMRVDDGTGIVDVRKWVDNTDEAAAAGGGDQGESAISVGMYVRVYGDLRSFQGSLIIISTRILLIQDYNEITYNLLLSITAHLNNTRGPIPQLTVGADGSAAIGNGAAAAAAAGGAGSIYGAAAGMGGAGSMSMYSGGAGGMGGFGGGGMGGGGGSSSFPSRNHETVYNALKADDNEVGLSVQDLYYKLDKSIDLNTINECIRYLIDEGHIYTSNDEDHYLAQ